MKQLSSKPITSLLLLFVFFQSKPGAQNAFVNDGASVSLESGAAVYIVGNLENKNPGSFTNAGIIYLSGNLIHNSTGNLNASSSGTFRFNGTANQIISGTRIPDFYDLTIDKTSGECQLQTGITLSNQLTFTSGAVFLNNQQIDLLTTGELINESPGNNIYDLPDGTGTVKIIRTLNAPSAVNPGNLGAIITSSQNLGATTIIRGHQEQLIMSANSIRRYYDIIPSTNSALNATLRFNYFESELNGQPEDELIQWHLPAGGFVWVERGGTLNMGSNYVELPGIDSFNSRQSLVSYNVAPLPLKLLEFTAAKTPHGKVVLSWKTADEILFSHFDIERSFDQLNWAKIGTVGASGATGTVQSYQFIDQSPSDQYNYYRLKQIDIDGRFDYSTIRLIRFDKKQSVQVFPTLLKANSHLFISGISPEKAKAELYDSKGNLLLRIRLDSNSFLLPQLPAGIYYVKIINTDNLTVVVTTQLFIY